MLGDYGLQVHLPQSADDGARLPVLWVLDARNLLPLVVSVMDWLSRRPDATGIRPMLIAGLDRAAPDKAGRFHDLTFEAPADPASIPPGAGHGGANLFADLLAGPACDAVSKAFAPDLSRTALLGHSLAGQFALRLAAERPGLFAVTGAVSPSIWWNAPVLFDRIGEMPDRGQALFLAAGSREQPDAPQTADEQRRGARHMVSNLHHAAGLLTARLGATRVESRVAGGEDHASALVAMLPDFLRFASRHIAARDA